MIVLKIIDRINIKGRGTVYTVKYNKDVLVRINDIFYDAVGNRFKVIGIELLRKCFGNLDSLDEFLGILFELVDGLDAVGDKLFSEKTSILVDASEQDEGKKA